MSRDRPLRSIYRVLIIQSFLMLEPSWRKSIMDRIWHLFKCTVTNLFIFANFKIAFPIRFVILIVNGNNGSYQGLLVLSVKLYIFAFAHILKIVSTARNQKSWNCLWLIRRLVLHIKHILFDEAIFLSLISMFHRMHHPRQYKISHFIFYQYITSLAVRRIMIVAAHLSVRNIYYCLVVTTSIIK